MSEDELKKYSTKMKYLKQGVDSLFNEENRKKMNLRKNFFM
jgi:hypothetical protein